MEQATAIDNELRELRFGVEDYWQGYKLFCYAYYSHSLRHEFEFRQSKLGQLVWRRHARLPLPSHHGVRTTCMQLLPLVEMYCKWELQEDCTNLRTLMLRFDSEPELESHDLGRSLLFMVRDDDGGLDSLPQGVRLVAPPNPFDVVRERLADVDLAFRDLNPHVNLVQGFFSKCKLAEKLVLTLEKTFTLLSNLEWHSTCDWSRLKLKMLYNFAFNIIYWPLCHLTSYSPSFSIFVSNQVLNHLPFIFYFLWILVCCPLHTFKFHWIMDSQSIARSPCFQPWEVIMRYNQWTLNL